MPRKPKPKNTLPAGERAKLYQAAQEEKQRRLSGEPDSMSQDDNTALHDFEGIKTVLREKPPVKTEKKSLQATVTVNFAVPAGEIKPVHGLCNGPVSYGADLSSVFSEIGVPYVRFDGTDGPLSGYAVDVTRIFQEPGADPFDENNYDFTLTDRYVEAALRCGARIIYRLGESYDLLGVVKKRLPKDVDKLTQICIKIIDHYNEYFASGYSLEIEYFELWSCEGADDAEVQASFDIYRKLSQAIKLHDGKLKVGGMCFSGFDKTAREFLRFCGKNALPLDFLSLSCFASDPGELEEQRKRAFGYLRNIGYGETCVLIGKWGYLDAAALENKSAAEVLKGQNEKNLLARINLFKEQGSIKGAAFAAAVLLQLAQAEGVLSACYYDAQPAISPFGGLCDRFGKKQKTFYAFRAFGELYRAKQAVYCESKQKTGYAHTGIYAGAAISKGREGYILIASFEGCGTVDLRLDGIPEDFMTAEVYFLDGVKDLTLGATTPLSGMKKRLVLNLSEYGVALVKLF